MCEEHQLVRKPSMLEAGDQAQCYPVRIELACERNTRDMEAFSSGRIIHFLKTILFIRNGGTHVSYGGIQSVLEEGMPHTLLH
jgi:hypothetical protein